MKNLSNNFKPRFTVPLLLMATLGLWACKKNFMDAHPYGQYATEQIQTKAGIDIVLIGAYGAIDGESQFKYGENWFATATNWVFGDIASDDTYKGTDANDQPLMTAVEIYNWLPNNSSFMTRWTAIYDGIAKANTTLKLLASTKEVNPSEVTPEYEKEVQAECRFIRGWQHFEAKRMWNNIPYMSDTTTVPDNTAAGNADNVWKLIEADFQFAYDNLPADGKQSAPGRPNKWAAYAYLGKAKLYQGLYAEALPIFTKVITEGTTWDGTPYALLPYYWQNFDARYKNKSESVFAIQYAASGSQEGDGSRGYGLAFPYGGDFGCCGFMQPSLNLVNAYQTDANGLPKADPQSTPVKTDEGIKSDQPYTVGTENMDPRADWSAGRRGIPFYDWGPHPGYLWIRDQGYAGPYSPKKHIYSQADKADGLIATGWRNVTSKNYNAMRFADVLLMAAECEVEAGSLANAQKYVDMVRKRAEDPGSWVKDSPAKYVIKTYAEAGDVTTFADKAKAREAVRNERRFELAMEGSRWFDLMRYSVPNGPTPTYLENVLNTYVAGEKDHRLYLKSANTVAAKNHYYPIPEREITLAKGSLKQNDGY
jgi:starch-binding outer membrane protein, SusD/RagB family